MGDSMEITYEVLHSSAKGWRDGLHWLSEVKQWSDEYEESHMVSADSNRELANSLLNSLLPRKPAGCRKRCMKMVAVLLGDPLRQSMMQVKFHFPVNPG